MVGGSTKKVRSVDTYLSLLERADRSKATISSYRSSLQFFAQFLGVELTDLHNHLTIENLMAYLDGPRMRSLSANSRRTAIAGISRYMKLNGVEFDELEMAVVRVRKTEERQDKPLEYETVLRMVDLADVRMKAVITFLISTGCRIGETSNLRLQDIQDTVVTVPNPIAKGRRGGKVYLNAEAEEYLSLWLRERNAWTATADQRAENMRQARPKKDDRVFASSYSSLAQAFNALYVAVDGETTPTLRGNRCKITPHACRAYFRTHAVKTMGIDLVEGIMRHTGYLNAAYVRMADEERERLYHDGEHVLYITRKDQRIQDDKLVRLEREKAEQADRINKVEGEIEIMRAHLAALDKRKVRES